jgi:6-phosphogluconate dehydrogenase
MGRIGFIGLGRMGMGMAERLLRGGHKVVAFNRHYDKTRAIVRKGASGSKTVEELVSKLGSGRRIVWLMLPAGAATEGMIKSLLKILKKGDIIIDGANDFFRNAEKHGKLCSRRGVHFFDVGVSGGVHGLKNGFTLMIGGPKREFSRIEGFCKTLAPRGGYGYFGEVGSGHFVKSVHNIVEYVYLQGIAEGVELLDRKGVDIEKALRVWGPASVVRSWLVDLAGEALSKPGFSKIGTKIGSVTIGELNSTKREVKGYAPAFDVAVRIRRDKSGRFKLGKRTIAAVRKEFGGHKVERRKK